VALDTVASLVLALIGVVAVAACRAPCPVDFVAIRRGEPPPTEKPVRAPKKEAWQDALGGLEAAKPHVRARLVALPQYLLADRAALPATNSAFALRLARDTWRGVDALTDREHGLPVNHVTVTPGPAGGVVADVADYASPTDIGLHLIATVAARDLGWLQSDEALARVRRILDTLDRLEAYRGLLFNYYDTTSLERTSNYVSFVDSAWLAAGLIVVRNALPEVAPRCTALIERADYGFFYDTRHRLLVQGYHADTRRPASAHYGMLYTEARLGALIAIGTGDVPVDAWYAMVRSFPASCPGQSLTPHAARRVLVNGHEVAAGYYEWEGARFVPSWGGSMFEALMPTIVLDERLYAPRSLGPNDTTHAHVQRRYAIEVLGYPIWGLSPCYVPPGGTYTEYGVEVLGALGYKAGIVAPYASALAIAAMPEEALTNLRTITQRFDSYGEFGLYDAVDPRTGAIAHVYVALDQAMLFVALANHLTGGSVQKWFAQDPIAQRVLPLLASEDFFD
jgi:hypothetical protein